MTRRDDIEGDVYRKFEWCKLFITFHGRASGIEKCWPLLSKDTRKSPYLKITEKVLSRYLHRIFSCDEVQKWRKVLIFWQRAILLVFSRGRQWHPRTSREKLLSEALLKCRHYQNWVWPSPPWYFGWLVYLKKKYENVTHDNWQQRAEITSFSLI